MTASIRHLGATSRWGLKEGRLRSRFLTGPVPGAHEVKAFLPAR
jgi:hypothetical protein